MNLSSEDYKDRRESRGTAPLAASDGITGLSAHSTLPEVTSRNTAADAIAEDPAKLRLAGRLISRSTTTSDIRFDKVATLRQAIEAGTYKVSSADLAEKLVQSLLG
jgi:anti-sigma28 factor (negative regulator of flagellin synthesis)